MSRLLAATASLCLFLSGACQALAQSATATGSFSAAATTRFPDPLPGGTVGTTFTGYFPAAVPYALQPFQVGTSGPYTLTLNNSPTVVSGLVIVRGAFLPNSAADPATPVANLLAGLQNFPTSQIPNFGLTAGTAYTALALFQLGNSGAYSLTFSGPGCITFTGSCGPDVASTLAALNLELSAT